MSADAKGTITSNEAQRRPIAIDLFAGAGGLSLGFEQAGFDVVAAVEYDPVHALTHAYNFPRCEVICRDVSKIRSSEIVDAAKRSFERMYPNSKWPGRVDAIIGGPPCQGFSTGGKRQTNDERNNLFLQFVRIVTEIRPSSVCLENVAGLLEERFSEVREEAFIRLRETGYSLSGTAELLNSAEFGVPQNRRRVVVLGILGTQEPGRPIPKAERVTVREAFEGLPRLTKYAILRVQDRIPLSQLDLDLRNESRSAYARLLSGLRVDPDDLSRPRSWDPHELSGLKRTEHSPATVRRFRTTTPGAVEPKSRLYRLDPERQARTLRAGTGAERGAHTSPRPIHPIEPRVITVREAARLHGYPDWFQFHATNWHGHRQIGNSVPPPLAAAAARVLVRGLCLQPPQLRTAEAPADRAFLSVNRTSALDHVNTVVGELPLKRIKTLGSALLSEAV